MPIQPLSAISRNVILLRETLIRIRTKEALQTIHLIRHKRRLYLHIKSCATPSSALLLKYKSISNKVRRLTRQVGHETTIY